MRVRMEIYEPQHPDAFVVDKSPAASQVIEGERLSAILIPAPSDFEWMNSFEAFGVFSNDIAGGARVIVWTVDAANVPRFLITNPTYQAELFRRLVTEPQTITTKTEQLEIAEGGAGQYTSAHKGNKIVFWHETGAQYDLSAFS